MTVESDKVADYDRIESVIPDSVFADILSEYDVMHNDLLDVFEETQYGLAEEPGVNIDNDRIIDDTRSIFVYEIYNIDPLIVSDVSDEMSKAMEQLHERTAKELANASQTVLNAVYVRPEDGETIERTDPETLSS